LPPLTPRILITNDDGIDAPGIARLDEALAALGETVVVAPAGNQSGAAHSLTLREPLRVHRLSPGRFSVDGTPTDCVNLGFFRLTDRAPDLVVSGVNAGLNIGDDVTYSGTVAAALEGALLGRPAIAVSLERGADESLWAPTLEFVRGLVVQVFERGLPEDTLLNVNVPASGVKGVRLTRQGRRVTEPDRPAPPMPSDSEWFWIGDVSPGWKDDPLSDYRAIRDGFISVTPLHPDFTNHRAFEHLAAWKLTAE